jgi:hypothetical protein
MKARRCEAWSTVATVDCDGLGQADKADDQEIRLQRRRGRAAALGTEWVPPTSSGQLASIPGRMSPESTLRAF